MISYTYNLKSSFYLIFKYNIIYIIKKNIIKRKFFSKNFKVNFFQFLNNISFNFQKNF